ncbi:MAG: hydroxyacylglutathione hydrolase [Gammaproteobacteria bacterium]|nr:hydroxyacylglutathione hydrolase [Gammaproteobacteria bacterium]
MPAGLEIEALPALRDNYIWALAKGGRAAVVDPGEAGPVERWLEATSHRLDAILVTHHHPDHTGGVAALKRRHGATVYGPAGEPIPARDEALREGDVVTPLAGGASFRILDIPGHTRGHIAYHGENLLFCGDTLFSAGCGRAFEGPPEQLFASLWKLGSLPGETAVYAGHEYTVANLEFARRVLPADARLEEALANALETRNNGKVTLPSSVAREQEINVFFRTGEKAVKAAVEQETGDSPGTPVEVFAALRNWKDHFRGD